MFQHVIQLKNWNVESKHLFSSYVDFIKACLFVIPEQIYSSNIFPNLVEIIIKINSLKKENLCFEILSTLINQYKLDELKDTFIILIPKLVEIQNKLENEKSKTFRDFKRNFLLFLVKTCSRSEFDKLYLILESISNGYTLNLFYNLAPSIQDIEEFMYKKLCIQQYCLIIAKYGKNLGVDVCKAYTLQIIISIDQFYKMTNYFLHDKDSTEIDDVYGANEKSSFKLRNLNLPVSCIFNLNFLF